VICIIDLAIVKYPSIVVSWIDIRLADIKFRIFALKRIFTITSVPFYLSNSTATQMSHELSRDERKMQALIAIIEKQEIKEKRKLEKKKQ